MGERGVAPHKTKKIQAPLDDEDEGFVGQNKGRSFLRAAQHTTKEPPLPMKRSAIL